MATERVTDRFIDTIQHIPERVQQVMTVLGALDAIRQGATIKHCRWTRDEIAPHAVQILKVDAMHFASEL